MIMEMTILGILVFLMTCIVIYMWINYYRHENLLNDYEKNHNQVKFYVARDSGGSLWLYMGKPIRFEKFFACGRGEILSSSDSFQKFGLNVHDFDNLKWEDEPVEVFLNLEN